MLIVLLISNLYIRLQIKAVYSADILKPKIYLTYKIYFKSVKKFRTSLYMIPLWRQVGGSKARQVFN